MKQCCIPGFCGYLGFHHGTGSEFPPVLPRYQEGTVLLHHEFDVVIVGGGNAGFGVSLILQDTEKSVAFIEDREFGGTCPNRGCTPKKVLVAAATAMHDIDLAKHHGIDVGPAKLNWGRLIARKDEMIGFIPDAMKSLAEKRSTVFEGWATFTGPNTVQVGADTIEGKDIVIATGSTPRPLPFPGADLTITSDEVLSDPELPSHVVFVGGGVIAMEFSHVYARAGAEVTILEAMPQVLPRHDVDGVAVLTAETERLGVTVKTGVKVNTIESNDGRVVISFEHEGSRHTITADRAVNGTGRIANIGGLDLEAANVKHDGIRIEVDEYLRSTSNPSVWVAGDALVHSAQLSPLATYEGQVVGKNIVNGITEKPDYSVVPSSVFTVPAFTSVGLTEAEAREQRCDIDVKTNDMSGWFSAKTYAETAAWAKVLIDKETDKILGAHLIGHRGEDLVQIFALAMRHGITATDLKDSPTAYPTFASDIKNLL